MHISLEQRSPVPVPASASSDSGASTDTSTGTPTNPSSGFPCPASDKSGAVVAARTQTVVDDITTVTCTYPGATGTCIYNGNGVFQLGSSGCPGAPASSSLSTSPSSTTTTASQPTNNSNDSDTNTPASNSSSRLTPAAIAGIASGTTIVVLLFLLLGVCVFRERRCKHKHEANKTAIAIKEGGTGYQSASVYINSQGLQVQVPLLPVGALAPFTYSYTLETGPPVGPEKGRLGPGETGKRFR